LASLSHSRWSIQPGDGRVPAAARTAGGGQLLSANLKRMPPFLKAILPGGGAIPLFLARALDGTLGLGLAIDLAVPGVMMTIQRGRHEWDPGYGRGRKGVLK
jgi:hypothetical protein